MAKMKICKKCGKKTEYLTDGLCDDCYIEENEGPCDCFTRLEWFGKEEDDRWKK